MLVQLSKSQGLELPDGFLACHPNVGILVKQGRFGDADRHYADSLAYIEGLRMVSGMPGGAGALCAASAPDAASQRLHAGRQRCLPGPPCQHDTPWHALPGWPPLQRPLGSGETWGGACTGPSAEMTCTGQF